MFSTMPAKDFCERVEHVALRIAEGVSPTSADVSLLVACARHAVKDTDDEPVSDETLEAAGYVRCFARSPAIRSWYLPTVNKLCVNREADGSFFLTPDSGGEFLLCSMGHLRKLRLQLMRSIGCVAVAGDNDDD